MAFMLQMARKILYFDTSIKKVPVQKNRQTTWDWQWKYEERSIEFFASTE
jgi:hypothetical protein